MHVYTGGKVAPQIILKIMSRIILHSIQYSIFIRFMKQHMIIGDYDFGTCTVLYSILYSFMLFRSSTSTVQYMKKKLQL